MSGQKRTLEELMIQLAEVNKRTGFQAREVEADSAGAMILDEHNPHDRDWWKDNRY